MPTFPFWKAASFGKSWSCCRPDTANALVGEVKTALGKQLFDIAIA